MQDGCLSMSTQAMHQGKTLTLFEEDSLVEFIIQSVERGFPYSRADVEKHANTLLAHRLGVKFRCLDIRWVYPFLQRHKLKLSKICACGQISPPLYPPSIQELVQTNIEWDNMVQQALSKSPDIHLEDLLMITTLDGPLVEPSMTGKGSFHHISFLCICSDGTAIEPWKSCNLDTNLMYVRVFLCHHLNVEFEFFYASKGQTLCFWEGLLRTKFLEWFNSLFQQHRNSKDTETQSCSKYIFLSAYSKFHSPLLWRAARHHNAILLGVPSHIVQAIEEAESTSFNRSCAEGSGATPALGKLNLDADLSKEPLSHFQQGMSIKLQFKRHSDISAYLNTSKVDEIARK